MGQGCVAECENSKTVVEYIIDNENVTEWTQIDEIDKNANFLQRNDSQYNTSITLVDIDEIDDELNLPSIIL